MSKTQPTKTLAFPPGAYDPGVASPAVAAHVEAKRVFLSHVAECMRCRMARAAVERFASDCMEGDLLSSVMDHKALERADEERAAS